MNETIAEKNKTISLHPKTDSDKAFIRLVLRECMLEYVNRHLQGWDEDLFQQRWKEIPGYVIQRGQEQVGFIYLRMIDKIAHIHEFHLLPAFQNQGIGSWVLSEQVQKLKAEGMEWIQLHVFKDNPAVSFYERHGFQIQGEGHLGTNWKMSCPLLQLTHE